MSASAGARIAHDDLRGEQVLRLFHFRCLVGDADVGFGGRGADPRDLGRIEAGALLAGQRTKRRIAGDDAHHGAVLRRGAVDVGGGRETAGARHVLRHHGRIARQVLVDVAGNGACPQIIAAARTEADDHLHGLAGIVIRRGRLGRGGKRAPDQQRRQQSKQTRRRFFLHEPFPPRFRMGYAPREAWQRRKPRLP